MVLPSPGFARKASESLLLTQFVEARLGENRDATGRSALLYANILKSLPTSSMVAAKSYRTAIQTGDMRQAIATARILESRGIVDPEMPLLMFNDAVMRRDWKAAEVALGQLEILRNFAFMEPLLKAWLDSVRGENFADDLDRAGAESTTRFYASDQAILLLLANGNTDTALRLLKPIIAEKEQSTIVLRMAVADHFLAMGKSDIALSLLDAAGSSAEARLTARIGQNPRVKGSSKIGLPRGLALLYNRLGTDLGNQRAAYLALFFAQNAQMLAPGSDDMTLGLARAYFANDDTRAAQTRLQNIAPSSPWSLIANNLLIGSLLSKDRAEEAEALARQALAVTPNQADLMVLVARALDLQKRDQEAAEILAKAVTAAEAQNASPTTLASYYVMLGSSQEKAGIWPEGLESLKKADSLVPNNATILNYLGYAQLERRENLTEAVKLIQKAYELNPSSAAITDSLGWAFFLTGDKVQAVEYLEKALQGEPADPTINEHLGDAYWQAGRRVEARYAWRTAAMLTEGENKSRLSAKLDSGLTEALIAP